MSTAGADINQNRRFVVLQLNDSFKPLTDGVAVCAENYARRLSTRGIPAAVGVPRVPGYEDIEDYPVFRYASVAIPGWHPYRAGVPDLDARFRYRLWMWLGQYVGADAVQNWTVPELPQERLRLHLRQPVTSARQIVSAASTIVKPLHKRAVDSDERPAVIVHAHAPFASGILGRRVRSRLRKVGVPTQLVATLHTKFHLDFQRNLPDPIVDQILRVIRRHFEAADQVWVPNAGTAETLQSYGFTGPIEVVANGSDLAPPDPAELAARREAGRARVSDALAPLGDRVFFLFVGRLNEAKNIDVILDALPQIADRDDWRMAFVGDGPDHKRFETKVRKTGLTERVTFLGSENDRGRLGDLYAAADLFVFPSVYDNDPLVVKEAAAFRTPAILASGSHAARGTVDGKNAFHVEPSGASLSDLLRRLLNERLSDREGILRVGEAAAREVFRSWDTVVDEVQDRYRVLADHAANA